MTLRSTSGGHADIQGPNSRFPWAGASKGQSLTAQSTPEAELISLSAGMKDRGEPALDIWQKLLEGDRPSGWEVQIKLHEDNTTAIHGVRTGKNPTMTTLQRNFGVKVGYMHERVCGNGEGTPTPYVLVHTASRHMSADIYTKGFTNR